MTQQSCGGVKSNKRYKVLCLALFIVLSQPVASGGVILTEHDGWGVSTTGWINVFAVQHDYDANGDASGGDRSLFRVRSGFVPNKLGLNIEAPETSGETKISGHFAIWGSIQSDQRWHTRRGGDLREVNITMENDAWGKFVFGRMLGLFHRQELYQDIFQGVGHGFGGGGDWASLGSLGYGYNFSDFNSGIEYSTPDMGGFKMILGIFDPAKISSFGYSDVGIGNVSDNATAATETDQPRIEGEFSYSTPIGESAKLNVYLSFLSQSAKFESTYGNVLAGDRAKSKGTAFGVNGNIRDFGFHLSTYTGEGSAIPASA